MRFSVAIITRNAAGGLDRALRSAAFADEIVVLDQHSTDDTAEVCARHRAALHQAEFEGFGPTKRKAADLCRNRWVFSLDTDEEITPDLRAALEALPDGPEEAAFSVNRLSRFLGRWIRHCGWYPDHVVRLFDRERAGFDDKPVHEGVAVRGPTGRLPGLLKHYTYETMEQYVGKLNRYTSLAAEEMRAEGRRSSLAAAFWRAEGTFWRMWLLQGGILDGWAGTVLCRASAFYVLSKYVKLWRMGDR